MKKSLQYLIWYFGIFQAGHVFLNIRSGIMYFTQGQFGYPPLPPATGWSEGLNLTFLSMGPLDTINAIVSAIWAVLALRGNRHARWLGLVTLTVTLYSDLLFDFLTLRGGGWVGSNLFWYILTNIGFIVIVVLFIQWIQYCLQTEQPTEH